MKLYGFAPSPNTWKVRALAAHLGVEMGIEFVDLTRPRDPAYLKLNPAGRVPTLVDGDFILWESNAIMQHIASLKPNSLWPDDDRKRADIARWQHWQLAHWGGEACDPLIFERVVKPFLELGAPDAAAVSRALDCFRREATLLEEHLTKQSYLVSDELTLADFSVASLLFIGPAGFPLEPYPKVQHWFGRIAALPAWQETAPALPITAAA